MTRWKAHTMRENKEKIIGLLPPTPDTIRSKDVYNTAKERFGFSSATVNKHLSSLIELGLVERKQPSHKFVYYSKSPSGKFINDIIIVRKNLSDIISMPNLQFKRINEEIGKYQTVEEWEQDSPLATKFFWGESYLDVIYTCFRELSLILMRTISGLEEFGTDKQIHVHLRGETLFPPDVASGEFYTRLSDDGIHLDLWSQLKEPTKAVEEYEKLRETLDVPSGVPTDISLLAMSVLAACIKYHADYANRGRVAEIVDEIHKDYPEVANRYASKDSLGLAVIIITDNGQGAGLVPDGLLKAVRENGHLYFWVE